ncbi:hypothetical protein GCM10010406_35110 [Streptomyces thermolineatus]|uniref:Transposase n=1 Tax=Streptomyces thermolineatus TaxID=44033 RepID=A0ABN3M543_9ACTN
MTLGEWSGGDLIVPVDKRKGQAPGVARAYRALGRTPGRGTAVPPRRAERHWSRERRGAVMGRGDGVDEQCGAAEAGAPRVVRPGGPAAAAPSQSGGGRCHAAPSHGR